MDPLTHTLVGASLAATRLGEKTRLAAPALLIGANLPDLDVLAYTQGSDFALGFRRGWTHGVLALVVLPALLATALWLGNRWWNRQSSDPPLAIGWLFGLSYLAVATHPTLDWLNTYGMRWWMPFRDTWYYGDSLFIVDPWLWLVLGTGWLLGRRATPRAVAPLALIAVLLLTTVTKWAPSYLPLVSVVFLAYLVALLFKPKSPLLTGARSAAGGLLLATLYIGSMIGLHTLTEDRVRHELSRAGVAPVQQLMIGPRPANPLAWDVVARVDRQIRFGEFFWTGKGRLQLAERVLPSARPSSMWQEIEASGQATGFLRWVRLPWFEVEGDGHQQHIHVMDARYAQKRRAGFGAFRFELPAAEVR